MKLVKLTGEAEHKTQTTLDTIEITRKLVSAWKSPPFQRELRVTPKVMCLAGEIAKTSVVPGLVTLGVLDKEIYVVDGQHRLYAFLASELAIGYADVCTHHFQTMAAMAGEFRRINSALVRLRPDDVLKAEEQGNVHLQRLRKKCPYVGYDAIRRSQHGPVLSMSTLLRVWGGSRNEVPAMRGTSLEAADSLTETETDLLVDFLGVCFEAWHRDVEYVRLWGALNLILCAWLWRQVVIGEPGRGQKRSNKLTRDQFRRGLLSLSADSSYLDYLVGRNISDRDRAPAYGRLKAIVARRYTEDTGQKLQLPGPTWAHATGQR